MSMKINLVKLQVKLRVVEKKIKESLLVAQAAKLAQDNELKIFIDKKIVILEIQEKNLNDAIYECYCRLRACEDIEFDELCTNMLLL